VSSWSNDQLTDAKRMNQPKPTVVPPRCCILITQRLNQADEGFERDIVFAWERSKDVISAGLDRGFGNTSADLE
jgi:hypothetical protein